MRARSVRSIVYFFSASRWPSASALSTSWPPRTASIAASSALRVSPLSRARRPIVALGLGDGEQEHLAGDELVAALGGLLLGALQQRREVAARLHLLAALHLRQAAEFGIEAGLQFAGVDAGARAPFRSA